MMNSNMPPWLSASEVNIVALQVHGLSTDESAPPLFSSPHPITPTHPNIVIHLACGRVRRPVSDSSKL